jgi:hypothetical protein
MTDEALDQRIHDWMETDWESEASRILELRRQGIETQTPSDKIGLFIM